MEVVQCRRGRSPIVIAQGRMADSKVDPELNADLLIETEPNRTFEEGRFISEC